MDFGRLVFPYLFVLTVIFFLHSCSVVFLFFSVKDILSQGHNCNPPNPIPPHPLASPPPVCVPVWLWTLSLPRCTKALRVYPIVTHPLEDCRHCRDLSNFLELQQKKEGGRRERKGKEHMNMIERGGEKKSEWGLNSKADPVWRSTSSTHHLYHMSMYCTDPIRCFSYSLRQAKRMKWETKKRRRGGVAGGEEGGTSLLTTLVIVSHPFGLVVRVCFGLLSFDFLLLYCIDLFSVDGFQCTVEMEAR